MQPRRRSGCFNPRPYERGDYLWVLKLYRVDVSIHAPTRGATDGYCLFHTLFGCFNPRPYERGDGEWH